MKHNIQQEKFSLFIEKNFIIEYEKNTTSYRIDVYNDVKKYDKYLIDKYIKTDDTFRVLNLFQNLKLEYYNGLLSLNFERKEHIYINYSSLEYGTQHNKEKFLNEVIKYLPQTDLTKKIDFSKRNIFGSTNHVFIKDIPFFNEKFIPLNVEPYVKNAITNNNFLINYI
jgi:hypothetical protein